MATDTQCEAAYRRLRPYCDGAVAPDELESLDSGLTDEPYYALSWLIADILGNHVDTPYDALLEAYALLDDEDKDEYLPMLEHRTRS